MKPLRLSGSQPFTQQPGVYIMIGERTNVAGSPKFAKLVKEGKSLDEIKNELKMPEYASFGSQERMPTNIEAAYKMVVGK